MRSDDVRAEFDGKVDYLFGFFHSQSVVRLNFKAVTAHISAQRGNDQPVIFQQLFILGFFLFRQRIGRKSAGGGVNLNAVQSEFCRDFNAFFVRLFEAVGYNSYFH